MNAFYFPSFAVFYRYQIVLFDDKDDKTLDKYLVPCIVPTLRQVQNLTTMPLDCT